MYLINISMKKINKLNGLLEQRKAIKIKRRKDKHINAIDRLVKELEDVEQG